MSFLFLLAGGEHTHGQRPSPRTSYTILYRVAPRVVPGTYHRVEHIVRSKTEVPSKHPRNQMLWSKIRRAFSVLRAVFYDVSSSLVVVDSQIVSEMGKNDVSSSYAQSTGIRHVIATNLSLSC